jgi:hypothetical protein
LPLARSAACLLAALAAGGCGSVLAHAHQRSGGGGSAAACTQRARRALARALATSAARIATAASVGNNSMPQCTFTVRGVRGERVEVLANVDSGPQPYFRLERQDVEMSQLLTASRLFAPPRSVLGLGLEADWFPSLGELLATDGKRLITIAVLRPRLGQQRQIAIGRAMARTYLVHTNPNGSLARAYP